MNPITVTAVATVTTLPPFWAMLQSLTWLHVFIGISSATVALVLRDYKTVWNILTSSKGKAEVVTAEQAIPVVLNALALSGHPLAPATMTQINTIVADANKVLAIPAQAPGPVNKSAFGFLLVVGLMALGAGLKATTLSLGPISLSPTASPVDVLVQPFVGSTFWRGESGAILNSESDVVGGFQIMAQAGPYGLGLAAAADKDLDNEVTYFAGGVAMEYMPFGEALCLWRDSGALIVLTVPWELGATAQ